MKYFTYALLFGMILVSTACDKGLIDQNVDKTKVNAKANVSLNGNWKLVESLLDPGDGSGKWLPVPDKTSLQFNGDGTTAGTTFPTYATYALKDTVTIAFTLSDNSRVEYFYKISEDTLTMSPSWPNRCIEACGIRFKKQ